MRSFLSPGTRGDRRHGEARQRSLAACCWQRNLHVHGLKKSTNLCLLTNDIRQVNIGQIILAALALALRILERQIIVLENVVLGRAPTAALQLDPVDRLVALVMLEAKSQAPASHGLVVDRGELNEPDELGKLFGISFDVGLVIGDEPRSPSAQNQAIDDSLAIGLLLELERKKG